MPARDIIQQTLTAPLRLVQGAVSSGQEQREDLQEALDGIHRRLDELESELEQRVVRAVQRANEPAERKLSGIETELAELRQRIEQVLEDVDHIRTEQAAARAREAS